MDGKNGRRPASVEADQCTNTRRKLPLPLTTSTLVFDKRELSRECKTEIPTDFNNCIGVIGYASEYYGFILLHLTGDLVHCIDVAGRN